MLKRLHLQNFTVFADADFEFGPGLNVLVGTNGTGKSHVLKLGYAVEIGREQVKSGTVAANIPSPTSEEKWGSFLLRYLPNLFQTFLLTPLISTSAPNRRAVVEAEFQTEYERTEGISFEIHPPKGAIGISGGGEITNAEAEAFAPILIPAKEILTLSWMLPASEQLILPIEQNQLHLLKQLRGLARRQPESPAAIEALTRIIGGEVQEDSGKYYLVQTNGQRLEMNMVAEGLRKFGTLQKLLLNGSLTTQTTLFWDEPEANLNPQLLRELAKVLAELARQGFQIILATHSMSLLKQLHVLARQPETKMPIYYFGLNAEPGGPTRVIRQDNFEYLPDVVALEVELELADNLEEVFIRDDREYHAKHHGEEPGI
jgi:ABC-type polar amino acid transport system ATPase subunit